MTDQTIHEVVRSHYGAIARNSDSELTLTASCCGGTSATAGACCGISADSGTDGCGSSLYKVEMLEGLPIDVTGLSLGCGDPVTIATLHEGERVLDLGSGGGIDCFLAAKRVGILGHVIGVDMTPEMIAKANANKAKTGFRNVEFRLGQIEALPVSADSVDVIMSNCVINLSPDKQSVFKESFRVLKSGGRVAISDIVTEGEFSPDLRAQTDQWAACVTGAIDVQAYTDMMARVGFVDITVVDKVTADVVTPQQGMPRIYSARITARKP
ncbi:MAG: arsenite methyltransferase [Anaerolineae bacterium]|nr:arsenite methyltransferase [Anaerolineae bacterium]